VLLDRLLRDVEVLAVTGDPAVEVTGVTHDSRAVARGTLFCCLPGRRSDGHSFAPEAVQAGASALLVERELPLEVTQVRVAHARAAMAPIAAEFHGHPSRLLRVVGVTGTNGKTTTTHLLRSILEAHGWGTGLIGTLSGTRTTPESTELQALLASMVEGGNEAVAMEVSSHALAQHRVDGTRFAVAVFTNLSRDHLDFHASMEEYFQTKARLFDPERSAVAVVNADDPYGRLLVESARMPTHPYALDDAVDLEVGAGGSRFRWQGEEVELPLGGRFNVANALAAATAARLLDVPASTIAAGLSATASVAGRFEMVDAGQPFSVIVDYAHTPDGLEQLLTAAREVAGGHRVIVVFGCGGDRDRTKRPAMGDVAGRLADRVVVTSDNPRSENPRAIIDEVMAGVGSRRAATVEPDREQAIVLALHEAEPGDVVVIAGKGHETTQTIGERVLPFDDRQVTRSQLERLQW